MRISSNLALCLCLAAAGCETMDGGGDGYLTHSDHRLTAAERAAVDARMRSYIKVPVTLSGLQASYRMSTGTVSVCGYASGLVRGRWTTPAIFAGTIDGAGRFTPLNVPGQGKDPKRVAAVRAHCQAEQINI